MDKELTLVILAAGMGSRFGGLKQVEKMGPNGEFILDYSIYDAILAGFNKIVFIIRKNNYELFRETIGKRVEGKIKVEYAFQENDQIEERYHLNLEREKPFGTAHAILCAKEKVNGNFAIINADDFYGRDAFIKAVEYLKNVDDDTSDYGMIAYETKNTLTENGSVKRGICYKKDGYLDKIIESKVERVDDKIIASPLDGSNSFTVSDDSIVSMNFFLFTKTIFNYIEDGLDSFIEDNKENLESAEYLIPDVLEENMKNNNITIKIIETSAKWYGITYKEDKDSVIKKLLEMHNNNIYESNLWN